MGNWNFRSSLCFIFFRLCRNLFSHSMFVGERGTQFMIKLPVFKKKKCSYLCNNFVSLEALKMLFRSLNEGKNCEILSGCTTPQTLQLYLEQTKLVHQRFALLGFFPIYHNIFPIIDQCNFSLLLDLWDRQ